MTGGVEIAEECTDYVRQHGRLYRGQVYVSEPGNLHCKKLIHAVAPRWREGSMQEENCLREAIHESLLAAEQLGLASIAFPALSAGICKFPIEVCAKIIVTTVAEYIGDNTPHLHTVSLVNTADDVVDAFREQLSAYKVQGKLS